MQNNFFLAWINLSGAFDFRICFGKKLVAFDFDENFTQSVAQIAMLYHMHMQCTQKCLIKNMGVKILILILAFVYFADFLLSL